jgi:hypothetical protein
MAAFDNSPDGAQQHVMAERLAGNEDDGHVRRFNGDVYQPVTAPEACDSTKVVLRPITNLVRRKNLDVVMIFSG